MGHWRRTLGARAVAAGVGLAVMAVPLMAGVATADHGTRTLDLAPERENSDVGTRRPIKAILSSAPDSGTSVTVSFRVDGAHDMTGSCTVVGDTADDPATNTNESTTCTWSYRGAQAGDDVVRGWIADTTPDENEGPSATPEETNNATDVVTTKWFDGLSGSTRLNCGPEPATALMGRRAALSCSVIRTATGSGVAGVKLDVENMGGANDGDATAVGPADLDDACTTDAEGGCEVGIPDSFEAGVAEICVWADEDDDTGYHATSEWDGGLCAEEGVADGDDNFNTTDVVELVWKHGRSVSARASSGRPVYGDRVVLAGTVESAVDDCAARAPVTIRRSVAGGGTERVATVAADADGRYTHVLRANRATTYSATVADDATCAAARSSLVRVLVRKKVEISAPNRVARGRMVRIRARLAPCGSLSGDAVGLYKSTNAGRTYRKVATVKTNDNCVAIFTTRVSRRLTFQARSSTRSPGFIAGASRAVTIGVRR